MLENFIKYRIFNNLPFTANDGQRQLVDRLSAFLIAHDARKVFVLRGYAGTGKTSMVAALVRTLTDLSQSCTLMAPTGRAAKVLSHYASKPAFTIHKAIYRQSNQADEAFTLMPNMHPNTLFIVDEASMIPRHVTNTPFGSGDLLDDLIRHVYSAPGCAMLLIGDSAQLPPVGCDSSPALDEHVLSGFGLNVWCHTLTDVARQALNSGILRLATTIRNGETIDLDQLHGLNDVTILEPNLFQEALEHSYYNEGIENTLIITRSNKRTNLYNNGVRASILFHDDLLCNSDRLMVCRNNYFFSKDYEGVPFIANGDLFELERVRNHREMYGYHFVDASLRGLDYEWSIDTTLLLECLTQDTPEDGYAIQHELFNRIAEDFPEVKNRKRLKELIYESPYYNALQVRYAYAVTCHKAQGGQWQHVFIDPGPNGLNDPRWLYTAVTRAIKHLFILRPPKTDK